MRYVAFVCVLISAFVDCDELLTEQEYSELPPIFQIGDLKECKRDNKTYCRLKITLTSQDNRSSTWINILKTKGSNQHYNHDELFHAICVEDECPGPINKKTLNEDLSGCYSRKYKDLGLKVHVVQSQCDYLTYEFGGYDLFFLVVIISYSSFVWIITIYDYLMGERNGDNKLVGIFSMCRNWKKLNKISTNSDFQKLKCIQGIRFYNMLLIIFCHTFSSYIGGYVQNTLYFETIHNSVVRDMMRNLLVFLVQTFFLFSAWLLSYHSFQIMENPNVSVGRYVGLTVLNRYLRIVPPVFIMVGCAYSTVIYKYAFDGPLKDVYSDAEYMRCQNNWWTTLFFVNNVCYKHDLCYFITWYLSADTQLYVLSVLIFALIWKTKKKPLHVISLFIILGIVLNAAICYINNLDIIYRLNPENSKIDNFRSFAFNATYSSTYSNLTTFMVGILFGYIYYMHRDQIFFDSNGKIFSWFILFLGLPTLIIYISLFKYSRITSALLIGFLKPLYAIGIGIGILGMKDKIGGIVRRICEWPFALFMGNFTYSAYVVHFAFVFHRTSSATKLLYISDYILLSSFVQDAIFSFLFGFFMHIMVEMPALQLQNMFVPQIKRSTKNQ